MSIRTLELTGSYADSNNINNMKKLSLIQKAAKYSTELGFDCHAGHGHNYDNVHDVASIDEIKELNIGHFIIGDAIFSGFKNSILKMKKIIRAARK